MGDRDSCDSAIPEESMDSEENFGSVYVRTVVCRWLCRVVPISARKTARSKLSKLQSSPKLLKTVEVFKVVRQISMLEVNASCVCAAHDRQTRFRIPCLRLNLVSAWRAVASRSF